MENFIYAPQFLLPQGVDMSAWAVVACDQFTSEPDYWDNLEKFVNGRRSTLNLVLPEIHLGEDNFAAAEKINSAMREYLASGVFRTTEKGLILIERETPYVKRRIGLMAAIDLEKYEYAEKSDAFIRSTEGTIEERIPPRLAVRKNAPFELSHIMLLYDDETRSVNEKLYENRDNFEKLYDFPLNMNGGHLCGWFIKDYGAVDAAFGKIAAKKPFLFAVGDGNHSLATAKTHWNEIKVSLTEKERETHPARFCLVEIVNVYDDGIYFEPIHRFVTGADKDFIAGLEKVKGDFTIYDGVEKSVKNGAPLPLGIKAVDEYIKKSGAAVDYVHGDEHLKKLVDGTPGSVGIMFNSLEKHKLFSYVAETGSLPRKTFSMGEGVEKRYYLEAKSIRAE